MRKFLAVTAAVALSAGVAATASAGNGSPFDTDSDGPVTFAVYGDAPYGTTPTDTSEFAATPAFIKSVNDDPKVRLVMHVGDIHSGSQYCTESYDRAVLGLWDAFKDPLVYTPGDNEWSDCHKVKEGGGLYNASTGQIDYVKDASGACVDYACGNPTANLDLVRSIFFAQPGVTLGGRKKAVLSQASAFDPAHPSDAKYVENVMWEQNQTVFVTVNIPGGSNNDADKWYGTPTASAAQTQEAAERTAADLRWIDAAFARAQADGAKAVLIQTQADMWDVDGKDPAHLQNYKPIVTSIASHTTAFGKPVLLLNGDSHVYKSDNPMSTANPLDAIYSPALNVPNFHRVVVHGSTFPLEWLKLTIDPAKNAPNGADAFGPFAWERITE